MMFPVFNLAVMVESHLERPVEYSGFRRCNIKAPSDVFPTAVL